MNVKQRLSDHADLGSYRHFDERTCSDVRWGAGVYWIAAPTEGPGVPHFDNESERKEGST
jgi:hypothetical protein